LLEFWDPAIKKAGLDDTVIVTIINSADFDEFDLDVAPGTTVEANGDPVIQLDPIKKD